MLPEAAGRRQHFQARGHSFSPYEPTLSRSIGLQVGLFTFNFVIELVYEPSASHSQKLQPANERVTQMTRQRKVY